MVALPVAASTPLTMLTLLRVYNTCDVVIGVLSYARYL